MDNFQQRRIELLQDQIDLYQAEIAMLSGGVISYEDKVIRAAERYFEVKDLKQKAKHPRLVKARAVVMKILRDRGFSLVETGRALSREYTTVIYSLKNHYTSQADIAAVRRLIG